MTKIIIILLLLGAFYFLYLRENFDVSGNLNLLTNTEIEFNKAVNIPISADPTDDIEVPKQLEFNNKVNITELQKLKAINNILERMREITVVKKELAIFNPALLPVTTFEPEYEKLDVINNLIVNKLLFYSGNQYQLDIVNIDNARGAETDDQYKIGYTVYGYIEKLKIKIFVELIITKASTNSSSMNILFTELRVDNPNVYITPYNSIDSKYELIGDYSKSLK